MLDTFASACSSRYRRSLISAAVGLLFTGAFAGTASAQAVKTLESGVLNVGLNGDMPMTSLKDGKLIGSDGEIMSLIAERLNLKVKPNLMEWAALIQSTKQASSTSCTAPWVGSKRVPRSWS